MKTNNFLNLRTKYKNSQLVIDTDIQLNVVVQNHLY